MGLGVGAHDERLVPLEKVEKWAPIHAGLLLAPLFGKLLDFLRHSNEAAKT